MFSFLMPLMNKNDEVRSNDCFFDKLDTKFTGYIHQFVFLVTDDIFDDFTIQTYLNANGENHVQSIGMLMHQFVGKVVSD